MNLPSGRWPRLALIVGLCHFSLLIWLGLSRHWGYLTSINDLGIFDQAVWGILNGAPFLNTNNPFGLPINWLGYHFNPILLVFAPFYLIYPAAEWLILFQAVAISITAWPLYLIARRVVQSERAAFMWAVVYLVNPFVLNAAFWDFHPVSLAAPFMALGVLAIEKSEPWLLGLACLFLLLIQEHFGIAVAGFGILWWLRNRSLVPALVTLGAGIAHTVLVVGVIMPALSPTGGHIMLSGDLGQLSRYSWLGNSVGALASNLLSHPVIVLKTVFVDLHGGFYLALLLLPFGFLPLVGIEFLIPALADLLANLLSANPMPRSVFAYHSISAMPLLAAAAIYGSARILPRLRVSSLGLGAEVLFASLLFGYLLAPLPLPSARNYWHPTGWPTEPEAELLEIRKLIPPGGSVSAQANVGAHFSQRYRLYAFPGQIEAVDFIVLRLASPTERIQGQSHGEIGSLGYHLTIPPQQYLRAVEQLLIGKTHGVAYWNSPWLVFSKEARTSEDTRRVVRSHLAYLEKAYMPEKYGQARPGKLAE